jgi:hypothetical protein
MKEIQEKREVQQQLMNDLMKQIKEKELKLQ